MKWLKQLFCKHKNIKQWNETHDDLIGYYSISVRECLNCGKRNEQELPYVSFNTMLSEARLNEISLPESAKRK